MKNLSKQTQINKGKEAKADKAAPKPKKAAKADKEKEPKKAPGPKLVAKDITPGIGHNGPHTGEKNPEAIKCLDELLAIQVQKKALSKAERDIRNRFKSEFGILASSVARELSLRKLDTDVRVQVETNHEDLKKMLGYQASLDFVGTEPTKASLKAQPKEDERDTEPKRDPAYIAKSAFHVAGDDEDVEDDGAEGGIITREG